MYKIFFLLCASCSLLGAGVKSPAFKSPVVKELSFSLLSGEHDEVNQKVHEFSKAERKACEAFAANYNEKIGHVGSKFSQKKIPPILHIVWIGPKPFPTTSLSNVQSWKIHHPDWVMKFWTDDPARPCPIEGMEKHLIGEIQMGPLEPFFKKTQNVTERMGLICYALLYWQGGTYIEHSIFCFRPFDPFRIFDFYAGIEGPSNITPGCDLLGARPGHPILKAAIDDILKRWDQVDAYYPGNGDQEVRVRLLHRGSYALAVATRQHLSTAGNIDMVLPTSYFSASKVFKKSTLKQLFKRGFVFAEERSGSPQ